MLHRQVFTQLLLLVVLVPLCVVAVPQPVVLPLTSVRPPGRKLTGKFLHITDVHPDPYYKTHSSTEGEHACHRGHGPAGIYGAETSDCDSPLTLVDATFKWINETIRDEIDFVIWTGDSARHDNDEKIPRSEKQVVQQNQLLVKKFLSVFGKPENHDDDDPTNDFTIPIIPNFGNNDILPHNIFTQGPNRWTSRFLRIWRQFIPEEQRHQFQRGGWFYVEVIPNKLAVISLNTLYFFDSNSAVDGCALKSEPGYEQMEWLRIQLQIMRERGMKAILMGHVPPARVDSKISWDETCWQKYTLWMQQYRDIVLASIYGHMNIDHFMLQDFRDVKKHFKKGVAMADQSSKQAEDEMFNAFASADYLVDLRDAFARIPTIRNNRIAGEEHGGWSSFFQSILKGGNESAQKKNRKGSGKDPLSKIGGEYGERYSLSLVSSSVVPNYLPTLRVFEYNITGLEEYTIPQSRSYMGNAPQSGFEAGFDTLSFPLSLDDTYDVDESAYEAAEILRVQRNREHEARRKKPRRHKFKLPEPPSKSAPPGPAYSPQTLSLLGYTHYAANLTHINNDFSQQSEDDDAGANKWKEGRHGGKVPKHDKPHPKTFKFQVEYDTFSDKVYKLKDLTVRSYIRLAKEIAASKHGGKHASSEDGEDEADLDPSSEDEDEEDEPEEGHDMDQDKKGKKKHKGKKGKKKRNRVWFAFIKRAFVGMMDPNDIEEVFGLQNADKEVFAESPESSEL